MRFRRIPIFRIVQEDYDAEETNRRRIHIVEITKDVILEY